MKHMVRNTVKYLKIVRILLSLSNQKIAEYRLSFYMTTVSIGLWLIADYVWLIIIYKFTHFFAGYNIWQYIGFLGFYFFFVNSFWFLFDYSLNKLSNDIYEGKIDMLITKPVDSQFLASFNEFDVPSVFNLIFGLGVFIFSILKLQLSVNILQVIYLIIITFSGLASFYAIMFSVFSLTFWIGRSRAVQGLLHMIFHDPSKIPTAAYQGGVKVLFYFIIPVALVATVPTSILYFSIDYKLVLYYLAFTIVIFSLCRLIWRIGLRSYSSVSS